MKIKTVLFVILGLILIAIAGVGMVIYNHKDIIEVRRAEKESINDITVYNESINITANNTLVNTYTLEDVEDKTKSTDYKTEEQVDRGIEANDIPNGKYYIKLDGKYLDTSKADDQYEDIEFYTLTRDKKNQKVTINQDVFTGALVLEKEDSELPDDVYDIIIDPGHGGDDVGSIGADGTTYEKDLTLKISLALKEKLEAKGYKVAMTREDDENPGNLPDLANYGKGSRVGQSYEKHAKMFISMHYNTGGNSGYELYSSVNTSTDLSDMFQDAIEESLDGSAKIDYCDNGSCKVPLTYESKDEKDDKTDYFFAVRETAGRNVPTFSEDNKEDAKSTYGAEGIIFESGYIDNLEDLKMLSSDSTIDAETTEIANAIHKYIEAQ